MRRLGNVREGARERSRGGEGTFARGRGNVREGARECSRGGEGTFVRDEGTFARGDLQGHRTFATTFLAYKALKGGRGIDEPVLHNSIPVQRKLGKTNHNNPTSACSW